jgi:hypothetical protein
MVQCSEAPSSDVYVLYASTSMRPILLRLQCVYIMNRPDNTQKGKSELIMTTMKQLHIAALGSSFAAGPGIKPQSDALAGRSGNNYASLLAKRLDARLTDLTVSGATLLNVLKVRQETVFGGDFAPQLDELPSDADIVLLTAGGNVSDHILVSPLYPRTIYVQS